MITDTAPYNVNNCVPFTLAPKADLRVVKTAMAEEVGPNQLAFFHVEVFNDGPSDIISPTSSFVLTDVMVGPAKIVAVSSAFCQIGNPNDPGNITCSGLELDKGDKFDIWITVRANVDALPGQIITNTAAIASITGFVDPNLGNNSDTASIPVIVADEADLQVTKFVKPDGQVIAGKPFTYTVFVDNWGFSPAISVTLTDTMVSDGLFTVLGYSSDRPGAVCTPDTYPQGPTSFFNFGCVLPVLERGGRWTVQVTAVASDTMDVNNNARVWMARPYVDPNPDNNTDSASIHVVDTADLVIDKRVDPTSVVAGATLTYTVQILNKGPSAATNVVVVDTLPLGLQIVDGGIVAPAGAACGTTQGAAGNTVVTCNLSDLAVTADASITIVAKVDPTLPAGSVLFNQATVASAEFDPAMGDNISSVSTPVQSIADLSISKESLPASVVAGGAQFSYRIVISNTGTSAAKGVKLFDQLPAGIRFVAAEVLGVPGACGYEAGTNIVGCELGVLMPWTNPNPDMKQAVVNITVAAAANAAPGTVQNIVRTAADNDPVGAVATANTTITANATLSVAKSASVVEPVAAGSSYFYNLSVTNNGPSVARAVMVTDTLPSDVEFLFATGGSCSELAGTVTCSLGDLGVGQTASFQIHVRVKVDVASDTLLTNVMTATTTTTSTVWSASADVVARSVADLAIRKFGKPDGTVQAGDILTYTLLVDNYGPSVAQSVVVTDLLASNGSFTIVGAPGYCSPTSGSFTNSAVISCTLANMLPGTQMVFNIAVRADEAQDIDNVADVSSASHDPDMANNHAIVEHEVTAVSDLVVVKSGPVTVTAGLAINWTVVVTNNGPSTAEGVVVYDYVPAGVTVTGVSIAGCTLDTMNNIVTCNLGDLAPNAPVSFAVVGLVNAGLPQGAVLSNDVVVTSENFDDNNSNNRATWLSSGAEPGEPGGRQERASQPR